MGLSTGKGLFFFGTAAATALLLAGTDTAAGFTPPMDEAGREALDDASWCWCGTFEGLSDSFTFTFDRKAKYELLCFISKKKKKNWKIRIRGMSSQDVPEPIGNLTTPNLTG
jgi:hypothetical protein